MPRNKSLIFCSPQYDCARYVPVLDSCYYIAHADSNVCFDTNEPIVDLSAHAQSNAAVYWRTFRGFPSGVDGFEPLDPARLVFGNLRTRTIMMPWATDLVPAEIEPVKRGVESRFRNAELFKGNKVLFVGTVWKRNKEMLDQFAKACRHEKLKLSIKHIPETDKLIAATSSSYMAPAIQGEGHMKSSTEFYVPCRIMKNISYGALGVTNNTGVNNMFGGRLVFSNDLQELVQRYKHYVEHFGSPELEQMRSLIEEVQEHHTYFTRISACLALLKK